jgi:hypothetical protein
VYASGGLGGEPLIYARKYTFKPITSPKKYYKKFLLNEPKGSWGNEPTYEDSLPYLTYLEFDNSAIGFFQFALFCMTIRRFYLEWRSTYNTRLFILTENGLNRFIKEKVGGISLQDIELLESLDVRPKVKIKGNSAEVILACFDRNRGYSYLSVYIKHPNIFENIKDVVIVESRTKFFLD